jgi:predicted CXXCH cytochrome family protein
VALLASTTTLGADTVTVAGTKHDLSTNSAIKGADDPCMYCHEQSDSDEADYILSRTETAATFSLYSSSTMKATVESPGKATRFCMSCHDGTTPFDALHGSMGTANNDMRTIFPDSKSIVGTDLRSLHPVGVGISDESTNIKDWSVIESSGLKMFDGKIECTTCHDPHGKGGHTAMLRMDPINSTLCLVCHEK